MKNKKIAIIGHFGGNENILDGQTIKTKILYDELKHATDWEICKVDTYYKSKKPIRLLFESIITLIFTRDVIVLLSGNGMKFYFPLLGFFARVFGTRIYHDVIGGNLDRYVQKYPKFKSYLNSFKVNWVETLSLKRNLEKYEIYNCEVIPNFKRLNISQRIIHDFHEPFEFCIFSRVMKEKGIETAIDAIQIINDKVGHEICKLDIYGRIDADYQDRFETILKKSSNSINYRGVVPYDKSVDIISKYYALLFPTFWDGEGFPGTIIDAFSAGLPVIATDWNCNSEIVINEINGLLYPNGVLRDLVSAIEWVIEHKEEAGEMRKNCIKSARCFQPDLYIKKIINTIAL